MVDAPKREYDWRAAASLLKNFGGEPIPPLHVGKTGLPFFDALRLYGAIDLYLGLREDVVIEDQGRHWRINGRARRNMLRGRAETALERIAPGSRISAKGYCEEFRVSLERGVNFSEQATVQVGKELSGLDSALQNGIRDTAAAEYVTLQTGSSAGCCVSRMPLADGLLAFAGKTRIESIGVITFLPLFEGRVDLAKVVSPLRAWAGAPNVLCAQSLALLALKTSLFAEGYQERLTGVVFNTNLPGQRSDNYSGIVSIASTSVGRIRDSQFASHVYRTFREIVKRGWVKQGRKYQTNKYTADAMGMAYWLMQPVSKHLSAMITSQERLHRRRLVHIFSRAEYVREVFKMSYATWNGDYEVVQSFAKAVSSGIYHARMAAEKTQEAQRKAWYDEVTMLRSAPPKAFIEKALILIEQGHRERSDVGTAHRAEDFDVRKLVHSIGNDRNAFETFRDLFRMYLVQSSTYTARNEPAATDNDSLPSSGIESEAEREGEQ